MITATLPFYPTSEDMTSGAEFSEDKKRRYWLWRIWDKSKPVVMFIGLNPSKANEENDDATIRRVKRFAKDNGYGGFYMCNLFTLVSTDPDGLLTETCAIQEGSDFSYLMHISKRVQDVVFAWGAFKQAKLRSAKVIELFPDAYCLGRTKDGNPRHPLFLRADALKEKFNRK